MFHMNYAAPLSWYLRVWNARHSCPVGERSRESLLSRVNPCPCSHPVTGRQSDILARSFTQDAFRLHLTVRLPERFRAELRLRCLFCQTGLSRELAG